MKRFFIRHKIENKMTPWIEMDSVDSVEQALSIIKEETLYYQFNFTLDIQETKQFILITFEKLQKGNY